MSNPSNPNFNPGSLARMATDRYDFQKHVDGYSFKHIAESITLSPPINISSTDYNTVQSALYALSTIVVPVVTVPDATVSSKGIIQLSGDLGGTAASVKVNKLQGASVSTLAPTIVGQVLTWNGVAWAPASPSTTFIAAGDLFGSNITQTVIQIQGRAVYNIAPNNKDVLTWVNANNRWEPVAVHPTGTGFASVTSGSFDTAATANIRYTGGKFQTDTNIQYKNSSITGDLSWTPTTSNKTLTLPNATDTLIGRDTTDTLTNKTFDVTANDLTSTSQATGDLLKNNGSKFVRLPMGTGLQLLRVNSGATDLEWATIAEVTISQSGAGSLNNITTNDGSGNNAAMVRFTGDGAATDITLSGLASGSGVRKIVLAATSTSKLIVSHQDTNSSASNRIICPGNANWTVGTDGYAAEVMWDSVSSRWRLIGSLAQMT
jgi:hypothetical protein